MSLAQIEKAGGEGEALICPANHLGDYISRKICGLTMDEKVKQEWIHNNIQEQAEKAFIKTRLNTPRELISTIDGFPTGETPTIDGVPVEGKMETLLVDVIDNYRPELVTIALAIRELCISKEGISDDILEFFRTGINKDELDGAYEDMENKYEESLRVQQSFDSLEYQKNYDTTAYSEYYEDIKKILQSIYEKPHFMSPNEMARGKCYLYVREGKNENTVRRASGNDIVFDSKSQNIFIISEGKIRLLEESFTKLITTKIWRN